jgi:hypothetical protein
MSQQEYGTIAGESQHRSQIRREKNWKFHVDVEELKWRTTETIS